MTATDILTQLEQRGCRVKVVGEKLKVRGPLTDDLRAAIRENKAELVALLSGRPVKETFWPGVKSKVYRARQACLEVGHCLQWSREADCNLFPLTWRWGWCRERVSMRKRPEAVRRGKQA